VNRRSANLLLVMATIAALTVVPDWPHRNVADPNYWGVAVLILVVLKRGGRSWNPGSANRRAILAFLVLVLPVVYVADRLRFGGSHLELGIEAGGLGCWVILAVIARRSDLALWLGCALHGLWDAAHFGRVGFVPEWYAAACIAADVGLGAFVLIRLREISRLEAP
jgi:hypothetical protein